MLHKNVDKDYIREAELCVPIGKWNKQFINNLKQFWQMYTPDDTEVYKIKRHAAHDALVVLKFFSII